MSIDKHEEIVSFLRNMKLLLQNSNPNNPGWTISTIREKNIETLAELELDFEDVKDILLSLTPDDYCEGPVQDSKIAGDLWIFGKKIKLREVYIKLKIWGDQRFQQLRVLSFHVAIKKINYYFKK